MREGLHSHVPEDQFSVRQRQTGDMPACIASLAVVHEVSGYPTNWPADPARWLTPSGTLHAWVTTGALPISGHVVVRQPSFHIAGSAAAEVSRLYVVPSVRRRGVAFALLSTTMKWAADNELDLGLEVTDGLTAARALYERAGFALIATKPADWTSPDGRPVLLHHYAWTRSID
jgi:GNAT superfamily N-acetyltransferase